MVADKAADTEVHMVADMEVHKIAGKVADMVDPYLNQSCRTEAASSPPWTPLFKTLVAF